MPVTAKLSRKFYEKLGDDIANELVEWFNAVDATYRLDLRELNDLNFDRFDAKLEQRLAALHAELRTELSGRIAELRTDVISRFAELRSELQVGFKQVDVTAAQREARLIRWLFALWIAQAAATVGLIFGVVRALQ